MWTKPDKKRYLFYERKGKNRFSPQRKLVGKDPMLNKIKRISKMGFGKEKSNLLFFFPTSLATRIKAYILF